MYDTLKDYDACRYGSVSKHLNSIQPICKKKDTLSIGIYHIYQLICYIMYLRVKAKCLPPTAI
jgi:hypothetical protein